MATISYEVCDRCGDKINYRTKLRAKVHRTKVNWILFGTVNTKEYHLCGKCSQVLDKFFYSEQKAKEGYHEV